MWRRCMHAPSRSAEDKARQFFVVLTLACMTGCVVLLFVRPSRIAPHPVALWPFVACAE